MKQFLVLLSLLLMGFITVQDSKTKIFIAGDSTAQTYNEERDGLIKGWGQMLDCYLNENIEVVNHAIGGRSTNSFIAEGRWDKLLSEVKPGDYVFIQFGHNDASTRPERHTSYEEYEVNLKRMIEDVRKKDAHPVLLTSLVMRTFVNGHLIDDRLKGYPVITRKVAKEEDVPLIDINLKSHDFITMLGDEESKPYYRWVEPGVDPKKPDGLQDDTHMMEKGAKQVAQFVAEGIAELNLSGLSENIILIK
jgi:lysophospholipase L1-like esterase